MKISEDWLDGVLASLEATDGDAAQQVLGLDPTAPGRYFRAGDTPQQCAAALSSMAWNRNPRTGLGVVDLEIDHGDGETLRLDANTAIVAAYQGQLLKLQPARGRVSVLSELLAVTQ